MKVAQGALDMQGRIFYVEFKAAEKLPGLPLERLLVVGLYGYNDPHTVRAKAEKLISSCKSKIDKYTKRFPTGKVIVLGDFNVAAGSLLDTDRGCEGSEKDAWYIAAVESLGVLDAFRWWHPLQTAITRKGRGGLEYHASNYLNFFYGFSWWRIVTFRITQDICANIVAILTCIKI